MPTQKEPTCITPATNPLKFMTVTTNLSLTEDLKKKDTFPMVLKLNALETIALRYPEKDWLRVYTDESQVDETNTAGAGLHCRLFLQYVNVGVNKSNFDKDIEAISLALQQLMYRLQAFEKVVILVDSKAAIQTVSSNSQPKSKKINNIKQALKYLQAFKKIVTCQCVPSCVRLEGNKVAEKLANKGSTLHSKEIPSQADSLKKLLNQKITMKYNKKPMSWS